MTAPPCKGCDQIRSDLASSIKAGEVVAVLRTALAGAKLLAKKTIAPPPVTKSLGR